MRALYSAGALALVCLLLGLPGLRRGRPWLYLAGAVLFVFALALATLTDLASLLPWLPPVPGHSHWHDAWHQQLLELLVSGVAIALLVGRGGWRREELGLRLRFEPGTGRDVRRFLLPLLLAEVGVLWLLVPGAPTLLGNHLFMLTAPGLTEELAFRGVLLALLDRAFPGRVRVLRASLGWGTVVSSVVFGLMHSLRVSSDWHVTLPVGPMLIPLVGGFVLAWCRARSGSLLLPLFVHSGMNEVAQLVAVVKNGGLR